MHHFAKSTERTLEVSGNFSGKEWKRAFFKAFLKGTLENLWKNFGKKVKIVGVS